MKFLIFVVFLMNGYFSHSAFAAISYDITPATINQQIKERGLLAVYQELFSDQTAANMVLLAIDSGTSDWLEIAIKFMQIEHSRTQSMLTMSVGEALQWSPESIIGNEILLREFPLKKICGVEGLYEWRRFSLFLTQTALMRRFQIINTVEEATLQDKKTSCLKILESALQEIKNTMKNSVPEYP